MARAGLAAAFAALAALWLAIDGERVRLRAEVAAAEARFQRMQRDVVEAQRLRRQIAPPALRGKALADALSASLAGHRLPLAVTALGGERVEVKGLASFDEFMTWLGASQPSTRARLVSLVATREGELSRIEAVLGGQ